MVRLRVEAQRLCSSCDPCGPCGSVRVRAVRADTCGPCGSVQVRAGPCRSVRSVRFVAQVICTYALHMVDSRPRQPRQLTPWLTQHSQHTTVHL